MAGKHTHASLLLLLKHKQRKENTNKIISISILFNRFSYWVYIERKTILLGCHGNSDYFVAVYFKFIKLLLVFCTNETSKKYSFKISIFQCV